VKSAGDFSEINAIFGRKLMKIWAKFKGDFTQISTLIVDKRREKRGERREISLRISVLS